MASRLNVSQETSQLIRFALVGFFLAGVYSAIYWYLATYVMPPMAAVVIAFLVSDDASYVNGQIIYVAGGPAGVLM